MNSLARLIDEFRARRTDEAMAQVVAAGTADEFDAADVWQLSDAMARSGTVAAFGDGRPTADLASTGGPSSLSTLLGPLYLHSYEFIVPKLGVPGRPAGGIDVLAQLPGYKIRLNLSEINDVIERCGYAHFLADENFAPLDATFFGTAKWRVRRMYRRWRRRACSQRRSPAEFVLPAWTCAWRRMGISGRRSTKLRALRQCSAQQREWPELRLSRC
jgi:hypothetical protein